MQTRTKASDERVAKRRETSMRRAMEEQMRATGRARGVTRHHKEAIWRDEGERGNSRDASQGREEDMQNRTEENEERVM